MILEDVPKAALLSASLSLSLLHFERSCFYLQNAVLFRGADESDTD